MRPNYKGGLVLESKEEQLEALITVNTAMVAIDSNQAVHPID